MSLYYIDNKAILSDEGSFDIEKRDPSLNGKKAGSISCEFRLNSCDFTKLFFSNLEIDYISQYVLSKNLEFRVLTHPYATNTCFEKAELLGSWDPLNVIKAFYFEHSSDGFLYAVVIPETGCFINRERLKDLLALRGEGFLKKAAVLPHNMSFGTCSPFITRRDLVKHGGRVCKIVFDSETVTTKKVDNTLDDFSFGLDHRLSLQLNYYHCYVMLKRLFPDTVEHKPVLNLSFRAKLVRNNGKIHITYDFSSLNYRTAKFINSIHGYGDVTIRNDYVDELDLPNILK